MAALRSEDDRESDGVERCQDAKGLCEIGDDIPREKEVRKWPYKNREMEQEQRIHQIVDDLPSHRAAFRIILSQQLETLWQAATALAGLQQR